MFDKLAIFFKANFNWHGKSERYSDCVVMYCTCTMVVALSLMYNTFTTYNSKQVKIVDLNKCSSYFSAIDCTVLLEPTGRGQQEW